MTYVVAYLRVSTSEQRMNGTGFSRQCESIERFCAYRNWEPQFALMEDVSGAIDCAAREDLLETMESMSEVADPEKIIVVESSSRWARDVIVGEVLLSKCREFGIKVWSAEGIELTADDPDNPSAVAIRQILAVMAQLDKSNIVLRLKSARRIRRNMMQAIAKSGVGPAGIEGVKPYGMLEGELQTLISMLDMQSSGSTPGEIAQELNIQKVATRRGATWSRRVVSKILKSPRSLGLVSNYVQSLPL